MNNLISNDELLYKQKYLKYKSKYLDLKDQEGGGFFSKDTSLLLFNRDAYPTLIEAIEKYKTHLQNEVQLKADPSEPSEQGKGKPKSPNQIKLSALDINGVPSMWKYTLGTEKIEPVFDIFAQFIGSDSSNEKELKDSKVNKTELKNLKDDYIKKNTIDLKNKTIPGLNVPYSKFLEKINCDTFQTKSYLIVKYINDSLASLDASRKEGINKMISKIYSTTIAAPSEDLNKNYRPYGITKPLGMTLSSGNPPQVERLALVDDFILINDFKSGSMEDKGKSLLGLKIDKSKSFITFTVNSIREPPIPPELQRMTQSQTQTQTQESQ